MSLFLQSKHGTRSILLGMILSFLSLSSLAPSAECRCSESCDLALASYYVWEGTNLTFTSQLFSVPPADIVAYSPPENIPNQDSVLARTRILVPFRCDCLENGEFLGRVFSYGVIPGDTYERVAERFYSNLTTVDSLRRFNSYTDNNIPDTGATLNVTVNCSCGDRDVSPDYGLFVTYPLRPGESLSSVANAANVSEDLVRRYNPGVNFNAGSGVVFVPGRDRNGNFPPMPKSTGLSTAGKAGISVAAIAGVFLLAGLIYVGFYRKRKEKVSLLPTSENQSHHFGQEVTALKGADSARAPDGAAPVISGITVEKSVEFSYEELASATGDFSLANKIGEGGFGAVYYAELRGEKAAIKKMDMQATKEFLAELKVLTRVHHLNLVRLIGYCVEGSLFLVYEYIENGNLSQHLRGTGRDPLPWSTRVQIALDSARGLEYIHEHTVPVYIHRDIKPANILIDKNFHAKVADFGLTKLTEVGSSSLPTRLVGTFGYMPPEYAQYGDVSPKVDVYAFGVVLYELISAKEAIVKANGSVAESKGLVALFEEVLSQPEPNDDIRTLVDPRLGDTYPLDSVRKMAQLAKACTHENPQIRPSMRSIVVALMTLSSSTEDWDVGAFYGNQGLINLMSGR
ncbi:chitin elicitor receptor kinase 1 [Ipomoea triloba]|uniref:chitin elicitor receptor kinase 1 n=1 Tax=Ipomoea triloba TaxID=35885 RepID=UPI00125E95D0|nr:chitin elicitor receptor kinase 1 [Ipomoea triloba]XP_031105751.1 chitin elicitor receptor kinase 1 [Ipomoea triloba]XP_031105752.1 chitin elicitor receptor kinase 1 [Ipomoea triloba]